MKSKFWQLLIGIFVVLLILLILLVVADYHLLYGRFGFGESYELSELRSQLTSAQQLVYVREMPRAKTLWDWMDLLLVPIAVTLLGLWFNRTQREHEQLMDQRRDKAEQRAIENRTQETALQHYLDRMHELLLEKNLCHPDVADEVRQIARVRTLTVLRRLDGRRVQYVIHFLQDLELVLGELPTISLAGADLRGAKLNNIELPHVNLNEAHLHEAILNGAHLNDASLAGVKLNKAELRKTVFQNANLEGANLENADLHQADLRGANLRNANCHATDLSSARLQGAILDSANLSEAKLPGAIPTDVSYNGETQWPENFTPPEIQEIAQTKAAD